MKAVIGSFVNVSQGETESLSSSARRSPVCSREGSPWDEASFGTMNEEDAGAPGPNDPLLSSHYLYVPNTAGTQNPEQSMSLITFTCARIMGLFPIIRVLMTL